MSNSKRITKKNTLTMHEIARLAGVSQSTVSRVLSGKASVDPAIQAAVLKIVEEMNYRPNAAARGLVSGKTLSVGILTRYLGSPFFAEILRGITAGLKGSGYLPIIALGGDTGRDDLEALDLLLERQVDALIVQVGNRISDEDLQQLAAERPLIVVGRNVRGLEQQCVCIRNYEAAYQAISYLIEKGHTCIAHISGPLSLNDAVERRDGYCQALIDHGLEVIPDLIVEGDFMESAGTAATEKLLRRRKEFPFSAIFIANDQMALSARLALYRRGLAVPDDVSLIGFDDQPSSQYMIPPLTTIRHPAYQMGVLSSQAALAMLGGKLLHLPALPLELVVRESIAIR